MSQSVIGKAVSIPIPMDSLDLYLIDSDRKDNAINVFYLHYIYPEVLQHGLFGKERVFFLGYSNCHFPVVQLKNFIPIK